MIPAASHRERGFGTELKRRFVRDVGRGIELSNARNGLVAAGWSQHGAREVSVRGLACAREERRSMS